MRIAREDSVVDLLVDLFLQVFRHPVPVIAGVGLDWLVDLELLDDDLLEEVREAVVDAAFVDARSDELFHLLERAEDADEAVDVRRVRRLVARLVPQPLRAVLPPFVVERALATQVLQKIEVDHLVAAAVRHLELDLVVVLVCEWGRAV